jgi:hypothetical protein
MAHAGRARIRLLARVVDGRVQDHGSEVRGQFLHRDPSRTQHHRHFGGEVQDGALHPDRARTTVEDEIDGIAQIVDHVLRARGTGRTAAIGARRGERTGLQEQGEGDRMCGHPHGNGGSPRRDGIGHVGMTRQDEGERTRPERLGQAPRALVESVSDLRDFLERGHVHDHRIVHRPSLHREDPAYARVVGRDGAEAVHRLRRKRDDPSRTQHAGGVGDRGGGRCDDAAHGILLERAGGPQDGAGPRNGLVCSHLVRREITAWPSAGPEPTGSCTPRIPNA